jgi:hypothetical protein
MQKFLKGTLAQILLPERRIKSLEVTKISNAKKG